MFKRYYYYLCVFSFSSCVVSNEIALPVYAETTENKSYEKNYEEVKALKESAFSDFLMLSSTLEGEGAINHGVNLNQLKQEMGVKKFEAGLGLIPHEERLVVEYIMNLLPQ